MMKNYLIIPAMPTPNGPLHLGHIGGPFLRADILARHLRQSGNKVKVLSGTDNFENYAERQAIKENKTPLQVCNTYYEQITDDLNTMNIKLDAFINLHDEAWLEKYEKWCFKLIQNANNVGKIYHREGELMLNLPKEFDLTGRGIDHSLLKSYRRHLEKSGFKTMLTSKSSWGVRFGDNRTLLSYGFIYAYYLMLAENYHEGSDNEFCLNSDTIIIASFGVDNTFPVLDSVLGHSSASAYFKPVDYYLINHFYHMQGKKFSTSSRHAVWVSEIKNKPAMSVDILRLYLASIDVNFQAGNYVPDEFEKFHDCFQPLITSLIHTPVVRSRCLHDNHNELKRVVSQALQPDNFRPHIVAKYIKDWISMGSIINPVSAEYDAWLRTLGYITFSIMPELSTKIQQLTEGNYYEAI